MPDALEANGQIGANVRRFRMSAGLSLGDLANATGVSKAHLSRLENGERSCSLATLLTLASAFGVSAAALLPAGMDAPAVVHSDEPVIRAADLEFRALTRRAGAALQPFRVTVPPDRSCQVGAEHPGEEWIFVLHGLITVHHGSASHTLGEGDAIHFDGTESHTISSKLGAELILVVQASAA